MSSAVQTSARVSSTARSLSVSIAAEVSAFFTANVPPNPQQVSASGSSTRSMPAHRAQQAQRAVAHLQQAQPVAGRVVGHPVRVVGADVLDAEDVHEQLAELVDARRDRGDVGREPVVAPRARPGAGSPRGPSPRTTPTA